MPLFENALTDLIAHKADEHKAAFLAQPEAEGRQNNVSCAQC
jgi:hypothetical protein